MMLAIAGAGRKRRYGYRLWLFAGLGTAVLLSGCRPARDPAALDQAMGDMVLVFPAQQRFVHAEMSPDGRWLFTATEEYGDEWGDGYHHRLFDLENNLQYELGQTPGFVRRWVDEKHLVGAGEVIRVSDMKRWPLQSIKPPPGSLGALEKASHIYAVDGFGCCYAFVSTDPDLPYSMATDFGASAGVVNEKLKAFLSDRPHTIVMRDVRYGSSEKAYSPDGRYYLKDGGFDDPKFKGMQSGPVMFDAATDERVAYAYKSGYSAYPLGWAADSSGIYVRFEPRMSMGQYLNHFIYKLLVPGAEKEEPPTFTPVPS